VLNALDAVGATRDRNLPRETDDLERLGYRCEELDLRRYADDMAGLTQRLQELDTVWVVGGKRVRPGPRHGADRASGRRC
jgi:hypothetical protein